MLMRYNIMETNEVIQDVIDFAYYMIDKFQNKKAAEDFLDAYDDEVSGLDMFPNGYRGIGLEYRGYEIRIKPFDTYNIFFVVNEEKHEVTILRLLKDKQNWNWILKVKNKYHFG